MNQLAGPQIAAHELQSFSEAQDVALFAEYARDSQYHLQDGNLIHATALINWSVTKMGLGNVIGPFACIGQPPQKIIKSGCGEIRIGNGNILREYVSVTCPQAGGITRLGDQNYLMTATNINHDCVLEDQVIIGSHSSIAGHCHIMKGCYVGMNAAVHQFSLLGSWALVGMGSTVIKKSRIFPGQKYAGSPVRALGLNQIGLERNGISHAQLAAEKRRYLQLAARPRATG